MSSHLPWSRTQHFQQSASPSAQQPPGAGVPVAEGAEVLRQELHDGGDVGVHADVAAHAVGVFAEFGLHLLALQLELGLRFFCLALCLCHLCLDECL